MVRKRRARGVRNQTASYRRRSSNGGFIPPLEYRRKDKHLKRSDDRTEEN